MKLGLLKTVCLNLFREGVVVFGKAVSVALVFLLINEYLIYPITLMKCSWPDHLSETPDDTVLKAMFLADTHLLGPFRGHWFDKLRREWQMHRSFQTAMFFFEPDAVFFLGDVFDEGNWVHGQDFKKYVDRFHSLFSVKGNGKTRSFAVTGNHDMGFHYEIIPYLHERFNKAFNTSSVRLLKLKGSNFLLLNSMAMELDNCFLCAAAVDKLTEISESLECEEFPETACEKFGLFRPASSGSFNRPILLQHFPMYRKSDGACIGEDTAPSNEKFTKFRESYDCLTKESSQLLFKLIKPRLILSGHTHHHCITEHLSNGEEGNPVLEYSVPSFSWRNRNDPSFYLAVITPTDFILSKCYLPKESTVYFIYTFGICLLILWILPIRSCIRKVGITGSFPYEGKRNLEYKTN